MNQIKTTAYSIIWKEFSSNSPQGRHLDSCKEFALPYLVSGKDKEYFEKGSSPDLKQIHLLMGILVGYNDSPPGVDIIYCKRLFPEILEDLKVYFGYQSIEKMIVDIASYIRKENGDQVSFMALLAGTEMLPNSSKIKFDCCVDLYNLLERDAFKDRTDGLLKLERLLLQIEESKIDHHLKKSLGTIKQFLDISSSEPGTKNI